MVISHIWLIIKGKNLRVKVIIKTITYLLSLIRFSYKREEKKRLKKPQKNLLDGKKNQSSLYIGESFFLDAFWIFKPHPSTYQPGVSLQNLEGTRRKTFSYSEHLGRKC